MPPTNTLSVLLVIAVIGLGSALDPASAPVHFSSHMVARDHVMFGPIQGFSSSGLRIGLSTISVVKCSVELPGYSRFV